MSMLEQDLRWRLQDIKVPKLWGSVDQNLAASESGDQDDNEPYPNK